MIKLDWYCIGHNPTTWATTLGIDNEKISIRAAIERCPDGSWAWHLGGIFRAYFGIEPNMRYAVEAATKAIEKMKEFIERPIGAKEGKYYANN